MTNNPTEPNVEVRLNDRLGELAALNDHLTAYKGELAAGLEKLSRSDTRRRTRVELGADLLDRKCDGWARRIDTQALRMDHCRLCVLGQLYSTYASGADALLLNTRPNASPTGTIAHGFYLPYHESRDSIDTARLATWRAEFKALGADWRAAVEARLAQPKGREDEEG